MTAGIVVTAVAGLVLARTAAPLVDAVLHPAPLKISKRPMLGASSDAYPSPTGNRRFE